MNHVDRRDLFRLVGAGWLTAKMARLSRAQTAHKTTTVPQESAAHALADPALIELAHQTAATSDALHECKAPEYLASFVPH